MNKKEFVELALEVFKPNIIDPKAFFEDLYDRVFREIEENIKKVEERANNLKIEIEELQRICKTS